MVSTRELLRRHALPATLAASNHDFLLDLTNLPTPDLSPIQWKLKLTSPSSARAMVIDGLCDNGAHSEFLSINVAKSLGLATILLASPTSVRLPDGSLLTVTHTATATVEID